MLVQIEIPAPLRLMFLIIVLQSFSTASHSQYTPDPNDSKNFKLTVVVLTMNRPNSLARLLNSIHDTDFENDEDNFDVEIHVDKSMGLHYDDCVA